MTSTGAFLKKPCTQAVHEFSRRILNAPLWLVSIAVTVLALVLRTWNSGHINNSISDLNARQALMAIDIIRGHFHFPNAPWICEYDEAGLAWLLVPWVKLFGHQWSVFKSFGAVLASLTPGVLTWIAGRHWNRRTGLTAGLLMATLPAQLVWDRHLVVCATAVSFIAWISSLRLVSVNPRDRRWRYILAGVIPGISTYVVQYSPLILPILAGITYQEDRRHGRRLSVTAGKITMTSFACLVAAAPVVIHKFYHPQYFQWRMRHVMTFTGHPGTDVRMYFMNLLGLLKELFVGDGIFYYLHDGLAVFTPVFSLLVLVGIGHLIVTDRRNALFVLGFPILLLLILGFISAEDWRGVYHVHYIVFFCIAAALGLDRLCRWVSGPSSSFSEPWTHALILAGIMVLHTVMFFYGPYRIHPPPYFMTRLQEDMRSGRDMPYLFSSDIPEVYHYHLPFWYVTRVDHPQVSIFTWNDDGWFTHPDHLPIAFEPDDGALVGVVVRSDRLKAFIQKIGPDRVKSWRRLPRSGVIVVRCRIQVPDILKRTWTDSLIPPILDVKKEP
ncbi:MAG TPA: glycosyltransferase family 39 protein [bacterium]|nr:glycosyltransferase family 39 protein [bacterium]